MHYVDRGPEPAGLAAVRGLLTGGWVRFYRNQQGKKPGDARWREFQPGLSVVFFSLCAYCETECRGYVDHFRPKSREPELVYEWTNWVLACPTCNQAKLEKWPAGGYVDPCAERASERPESFFAFDTTTTEVLPKEGLSEVRRRDAQRMIDDLKLNEAHHLKRRKTHLRVLDKALANADDDLVAYVSGREQSLSSISRQFLIESGFLPQ